MARTVKAGDTITHQVTIVNSGGGWGQFNLYCALGTESLIRTWETQEGTQVGETVQIGPGATKVVKLPYKIPADLPARGYGARAWMIDRSTGEEIPGDRVIGEAITVLAPVPKIELTKYEVV